MKTFQCQNCKYEELNYNKLPDNYKCPRCGVDKESFIEEEKMKKPIFLLFLYSLTLVFLILSGCFTISTIFNQNSIPQDKVKVGKLSMELVDQKDTKIRLYDTAPMSDEKAKTLDPFSFKIINNGTYALEYTLKLVDVPDNELGGIKEIIGKTRITNDKVKFSLTDTKANKVVKQGLISDLKNNIIIEEKLGAADIRQFDLRLWIDKNAGNEVQNKFYVGRLVLEIKEIID